MRNVHWPQHTTFKEVFKVEGHILKLHNLYDFSGHKVMETKGLPDDCDTVMIVGHNHAFTSIANMLETSILIMFLLVDLFKLNLAKTNGATLLPVKP